MNKKPKLFVIVCILVTVILSGCIEAGNDLHKDSSSSFKTSNVSSENTNSISIPQLGMDNYSVYHQTSGNITDNKKTEMIAVVSEKVETDKTEANFYLVVSINDKFIKYDLGKWECRALEQGFIDAVDVDNDGIDEIVLFLEVTGNGATLAQIYKVDNHSLFLFFDFNLFDKKIVAEYKNQYLLNLSYAPVGFSTDYNISKEFSPDKFDQNGKAIVESTIFYLPISDVRAEVSEDDDVVIYCRYGIRLTNYLGEIEVAYCFDSLADSMEIVSISKTATQGDGSSVLTD